MGRQPAVVTAPGLPICTSRVDSVTVGATPQRSLLEPRADLGDRCRNDNGSGAEGTRTPDPFHAMEVLYRLSYSPVRERPK